MATELIACPNCGEQNPAKFRLCGYCGTPLAPALPPQEERKTVTVFFSDLKGSTNLGEALDPESLREVMTTYFDSMTRVLRRHGATIEKFIGDAIMAVFGLPKLHEDDALRAVRAAKETQAAIADLNEDLQRRYGVQLTVRTGVNTGEVVAGDPTTGQRLVTGDTVNVAARLEQAAPPGEVLIGELTYRLVRGAVDVEEVEPLELKGKSERVPAYRLMAVSDATEGFERRQDAPMVGREHEMATLAGTFQRAVAERGCRAATVIADAGVGKSRLVREFTASLAERANVVHGRCLPYGEGITFWPLVEAARAAAVIEQDDAPDEARAKLAALTGDERVTERLAAAIGLGSEQFPVAETFWAARRFLEILARERPVCVVIDDIHWAEQTFLELIGHLVETVEDASVLLLCTSRPDLLEHHPEWATQPDAVRLVLQPLTDTDAGQVVAGLLGDAGIAGEVQERIVRAAEGNPLFVEQLLSMMIDNGALHFADNRWEPTGDLSDIDVPPTIQALLAARLDLLAREERAVIEPASVIGLSFAEAAVTELAPEPVRPNVPDHLASMTRKQLVRSDQVAGPEELGFRFGHILIRDAAYNGLLKRARATFHERFAEWAEELNARQGRSQEYEEILGYHLESAYHYLEELGTVDDHARSVGARGAEKLAAAGRRAMARGDMPAAANLLRRAAGCLAQDAIERLRLLPDLAEALMELPEFEEADRVLVEAIEGARAHGDLVLAGQAELVRLLVQQYSSEEGGWSETALQAVERIEPIFKMAGNAAGCGLASRLKVGIYGTANRFGESVVAAEEVIRYAREAGDPRLERRGFIGYTQAALYGPTPVDEAVTRCEELAAGTGGDRRTEALILHHLTQLYAMQGEFAKARSAGTRARQIYDDLGAGLLAAALSISVGQVELLAGNLADARAVLTEGYSAVQEMGGAFLQTGIAGLLGKVAYGESDLEEVARYSQTIESMADADDIDAQTEWRSLRSLALAHRGEAEEAMALARAAVEIARTAQAPLLLAGALVTLADVQQKAGEDASAACREALDLYRAKGDVVSTTLLESRTNGDAGA
ncbi:MAG TPA: adenylate/guanylate cyclase domain-containing protein [Candidatus Limnocylindria bacterium]|jgi:class 3 adenylate cyclase/tetratricopeptide (TPR) repeat protein|nr:adenylate/guanylate cyclase domain-containing protein [Candidatus Limnocylindria bacterium]